MTKATLEAGSQWVSRLLHFLEHLTVGFLSWNLSARLLEAYAIRAVGALVIALTDLPVILSLTGQHVDGRLHPAQHISYVTSVQLGLLGALERS